MVRNLLGAVRIGRLLRRLLRRLLLRRPLLELLRRVWELPVRLQWLLVRQILGRRLYWRL